MKTAPVLITSSLVASTLLLTLLTACAGPASPPATSEPEGPAETSSSPAVLAPCGDGTMTVAIGEPEGTAGHLNYEISFTNTGPDCTLEGYPQVAVIGHGNGTQLGVIADQIPGLTVAPITVATGDSAYALLQVINIDPGGGPLGPDCGLDHGDGYSIYVPGSIDPVIVEASGAVACTSGIPFMHIGPIAASYLG